MAVAARWFAGGPTMELPITGLEPMLVRPRPSTDPLDALVAQVHARNGGRFVDGLQVAALLEAHGVTDRAARVQYGFHDVFALAHEARTRLAGLAQPPERRTAGYRDRRQAARELGHGLLYLLPCVLFPAAAAVARPGPLVFAVIVAGLLGWVWSGGVTWLAHQYRNAGDDAAAGRFLAAAAVVGVGAGGLLGALVAARTGDRVAALLVPAVVAYQLAGSLLLFLEDEAWLAVLMSPAVVAGAAYLLGERRYPAAAWAPALACVAVTFAVAVRRAARLAQFQPGAVGPWALLRGRRLTFVLVVAHTALLAGLVLLAQAPYLTGHFEVLVAALPLAASMGFVEWRARRFGERARELTGRTWAPRRFRRRTWRMLAADAAACALAAAVVAAAVLAGLDRAGRLTPVAAAMAAANVALAAACYLIFVLAGHGGYGRLCGVLAVAVGAHLAAGPLVPADTLAFLASVVLLLGLLAVALAPTLGQVRQYR